MAEPWIRVHANIAHKPVVSRCAEALHVSRHEAIGLLVEFWGSVSQHSTNGDVSTFSDAQLEVWAGWHRRRGAFAAFVRALHLDTDGRVKEWDEYAGKLELRRAKERNRLREKRDKVRQQLQVVAQHPTNNSDGVVQPLQNVGTRARERNETIRNEITTTTSSSARAVADATVALAGRLATDVDREALGSLLALVPSPATWVADLAASLDGMPGHLLATPEQLGEAIRDFLGNGAAENPSLRNMRRYIESTVHPVPRPFPKLAGGTRNDTAIDAAVARLEGQHGKH